MSLTKKVSFSKISGIYSPKSPHNTSLQTEISRNASLRVEPPSSPSSSLRTRNKLSIENEIKSCLVDLRDLEEIELTAALWKRKHRPEYYTAKRERVDVNTAQKIRTLLSTLMLEEKEGRKLSSERSFLLEKADKLPLEFEEKQEHLRNIVHLTEGGKVNIAELENEATCLKRKLAQLHENRRTMQNGLHTKSKEIDKLLNELINLRDLEDQYLETINALRSVRSQQGELKEEEKTLRRLESRKLVFLNTLEKPSDFHDQINDLNSEKSVLHHRIRTRAQRKDIQSSSIHANNHELAVVEQQLHYLTLALKNHIKTRAEKSGPLSNESFSKSTGGNSTHTVVALEVEPSQMVPAGMLENVLGRIQQLRKTLALNHEQIKQRDVTVEKMERSIDILSHASESAQRRAEYEMKLHAEEYAQMQSIMEHRQSMFEEACEKLKQQQEQLKQRLEKLDMAFETQNSMEN